VYAIVKTGGKQYRVERGQRLLVERLPADEGASVALQPIMYRSEDTVFDANGLKQVKVSAKVIAHERGEKLRVVKFKPKRGYKRRTGHRQELTRIEVTDISMGAAAKAPAKPAAAVAHSAEERGGERAAPAPAKPAAAKTPAKPAAARRRPAAKKEATEDGA